VATEAAGFRQANRFAHLPHQHQDDGIRVTPTPLPTEGMGFQDTPKEQASYYDRFTPQRIKTVKTWTDNVAKEAKEKKTWNPYRRAPITSTLTTILALAAGMGAGLGIGYERSAPKGAISKSMRALASGMGSVPANAGHCFMMPDMKNVKVRNDNWMDNWKNEAITHPNGVVESAGNIDGAQVGQNWYKGDLIRGKQTYLNNITSFGDVPVQILDNSVPTYTFNNKTHEVRRYNPYVIAGTDQYALMGKWKALDQPGRQPTLQEMAMTSHCAGNNVGVSKRSVPSPEAPPVGPMPLTGEKDELKKRTKKIATAPKEGRFATLRKGLGLSSNTPRATVAKKAKAVKKRTERSRAGGSTIPTGYKRKTLSSTAN